MEKKSVLFTKQDTIVAMSKKTGLTQAECRAAYTALAETVIEALGNGCEIKLSGLGTFRTYLYRGYDRSHSNDGAPMHIPDRMRVIFRPTASLKALVNGKDK